MRSDFLINLENSLKKYPESKQLFHQLIHELQHLQRPANELLLDDWDLIEVLKVSKRSLANYREQGLLSYSKFGGKNFYLYSDVLESVTLNRVPAIHEQLRIGKGTYQ